MGEVSKRGERKPRKQVSRGPPSFISISARVSLPNLSSLPTVFFLFCGKLGQLLCVACVCVHTCSCVIPECVGILGYESIRGRAHTLSRTHLRTTYLVFFRNRQDDAHV